jgi:3-hydroxyisobutyrate dehydrogenase-like beta-hydroxyacid dehydrogenase
LAIFVKDLGLVTHEAADHGQRTDIATAAYQAFLDGKEAGLLAKDDSSVLEVMRSRRSAG